MEMKNMLLGAAVMVFLAGCFDEPEIDSKGRPAIDTSKNGSYIAGMIPYGTFKYIVVDGHEYLVCRFDRGVGITHSPKCDCLVNKGR